MNVECVRVCAFLQNSMEGVFDGSEVTRAMKKLLLSWNAKVNYQVLERS
jgi:hypothetical protein